MSYVMFRLNLQFLTNECIQLACFKADELRKLPEYAPLSEETKDKICQYKS